MSWDEDMRFYYRRNGLIANVKRERRMPDREAESPFFARVYEVVKKIPYGKVISYGQIAVLLDAPRCARQVGWAMRRCPDDLPWQRVVKADGTIAGGGHADLRRALLEGEGIPFLQDGRVDTARCQWDGSGARIALPDGVDDMMEPDYEEEG